MQFIYALDENSREELLVKGFEEISTCTLNGQKAYVFEDSPQKFATFSKEDQGKYLVTNVAYFV